VNIVTRLLAYCALASFGCADARPSLQPYSEIVLAPGMSVHATNPNGSVTITAGDGTRRLLQGDDWHKRLRMIARTTRWNGSLGLYDPADSNTQCGRVLAEEGQLFFDSPDQALRWLNVGSRQRQPVFTNDGLVFSYSVVHWHNSANCTIRDVNLWQIYIDGRRPRSLPGANDSAITIEGGSVPDTAQPHPVQVGYELRLASDPYKPR